jgi:hypothetical protein
MHTNSSHRYKWLALAAAVLAVMMIAQAKSSSSSSSSNQPSYDGVGAELVYDRIMTETDCATLQHEFDIAHSNHRGTSGPDPQLKYMEWADWQMEDIGCYDR